LFLKGLWKKYPKGDRKMANRIAVGLVAIFAVSVVWAGTYGGGDGSNINPYKISTPADWQELMNTPADWALNFLLIDDIDLSGITVTPIAPDINTGIEWFQGTAFMGIFDGNNHVIHNVNINLPINDYVGLFGYVGSSGQIKNLGMENSYIIGEDLVGGLVGMNELGNINLCYINGFVRGGYASSAGGLIGASNGTVFKCYASCTVNGTHYVGGLVGQNIGSVMSCYATGDISGESYVGGLVGLNGYDGYVSNSYSTSTVTGRNNAIGGLIGKNTHGIVSECYAIGSVSGAISGSGMDAGGLIGWNGYEGTVTSCYALGSVSGFRYVGGFVGENYDGKIIRCYSTGKPMGTSYVGGLCGRKTSGIGDTGNFWDTQTSQTTISAMGTGKTTVQMKTLTTYTATPALWDFVGETANGVEDIWYIKPNEYPRLTGTGPIGVVGWEFVSQRRISRTVYEYVYKVELANSLAANCYNVTLELRGAPANWTIIDGTAGCPQIDGQGQAVTADTLTFRVDRSASSNGDLLHWLITYQQTPGGEVKTTNAVSGWPGAEADSSADLNGDGSVDGADLAILMESWLSNTNPDADIAPAGGDGVVNMLDLAEMMGQWRP
jgi:hypothetical protein